MGKVREKTHRLPAEQYIGQKIVAFTLCIKNRQIAFNNEKLVGKIIEILRNETEKNRVVNWAYVFMPDHLHLAIQGMDEKSDLLKTINMFKQRSGWLLKTETHGKTEWQKDYYDHIIREKEDHLEQLRYIADNPVRRGLTTHWTEYIFTGSLDFDLKKVLVNSM